MKISIIILIGIAIVFSIPTKVVYQTNYCTSKYDYNCVVRAPLHKEITGVEHYYNYERGSGEYWHSYCTLHPNKCIY